MDPSQTSTHTYSTDPPTTFLHFPFSSLLRYSTYFSYLLVLLQLLSRCCSILSLRSMTFCSLVFHFSLLFSARCSILLYRVLAYFIYDFPCFSILIYVVDLSFEVFGEKSGRQKEVKTSKATFSCQTSEKLHFARSLASEELKQMDEFDES